MMVKNIFYNKNAEFLASAIPLFLAFVLFVLVVSIAYILFVSLPYSETKLKVELASESFSNEQRSLGYQHSLIDSNDILGVYNKLEKDIIRGQDISLLSLYAINAQQKAELKNSIVKTTDEFDKSFGNGKT
jgi:hypothetical protein